MGEVKMKCPFARRDLIKTWISKKDARLKHFLTQKRKLHYPRTTDCAELLALLFGTYISIMLCFTSDYTKYSLFKVFVSSHAFATKYILFVILIETPASLVFAFMTISECLFRIIELGGYLMILESNPSHLIKENSKAQGGEGTCPWT